MYAQTRESEREGEGEGGTNEGEVNIQDTYK